MRKKQKILLISSFIFFICLLSGMIFLLSAPKPTGSNAYIYETKGTVYVIPTTYSTDGSTSYSYNPATTSVSITYNGNNGKNYSVVSGSVSASSTAPYASNQGTYGANTSMTSSKRSSTTMISFALMYRSSLLLWLLIMKKSSIICFMKHMM